MITHSVYKPSFRPDLWGGYKKTLKIRKINFRISKNILGSLQLYSSLDHRADIGIHKKTVK
jgi:hypothetical protein